MNSTDFSIKAKQLIDSIKGICVNAGLGGDANEYKIVTQSFLYKFLNDKFLFEVNKLNPSIHTYDDLKKLSENEYELLMIKLGTKSAHLKPEHLLEYLFKEQNKSGFAKLFDETLNDIAVDNSDIFSVHTAGNTEIRLFEEALIQRSVSDNSRHDETARQIINKLADSKFDFQALFSAGFDFFSTLFEYMIKDYNKDGGGKYAEYYTPHSIAKIMAEILVGDSEPSNVTAYDPAAGSGTLLMNIAYKIGPDKCTIYSEDISQKSSNLLRLNLILNNLSHSIDHIVQGNTITEPKHIAKKFDFIVSNPPFDPQTSKEEYDIMKGVSDSQRERFPFGIPNLVSDKKSETGTKLYIYLVFLQHAIFSLSEAGKAAIVVPTGFLTQSGIGKNIRELLVEKKWLKGVVSMPPNIFATTGTNVSVLFIDKTNSNKVVLVDASKLGVDRDDDGKKRRFLSLDDENKIVTVFSNHQPIDGFSVVSSYEQIKEKKYSFSPGQYFDIKIDYVDITHDYFLNKIHNVKVGLNDNLGSTLESISKIIFDYWFVQFDFPDKRGMPYKSSGGKMVWSEELKREIPDGWTIGTLLDIANYTNGLPCQKYRPVGNGSLRVIKIREMHEGFSKDTELVRQDIPTDRIIEDGDVLFSWSASLEVQIWYGGKGALNQHIFKVTSDKYPKFFYYFQLINYLKHFKMMAANRKTTMGHITQEHLEQSRIVIPPKEFILQLDQLISPLLDRESISIIENQQLSKLRDWLLPMLMNGQVKVSE